VKDQLTNAATAEWLNACEDIHTEEQIALDRAELALNEARFMKVMRMTPQRFGLLDNAEKRNYRRWAKHLQKVFEEKASMIERNCPPELDVPTFLQRA
jgi:hypothetical protein